MQRSVGLSDVVRGLVLLMLVGGMGVGTVQAQSESPWTPKHTPSYEKDSRSAESSQRGVEDGRSRRAEGRVLTGNGCRGAWSLNGDAGTDAQATTSSAQCGACPKSEGQGKGAQEKTKCCLKDNGNINCVKPSKSCSGNSRPIPIGTSIWTLLMVLGSGGYGAYRLTPKG